MPTDPSKVNVEVVLSSLPQAAKEKVAAATSPLWKRVLYWCLGVLGLAGTAAMALWLLIRKKSVKTAMQQQVQNNTEAVRRNNEEAKTKVLEAELKQHEEVAEIRAVLDNPDRAAKVAEMERISNAICAEVNKP
jgi:C4-dicarboxylate-specific signal transduction histidine kinase